MTPYPSPFRAKGPGKEKKKFHLCFVLLCSGHVSFKMAAKKHAQFQLVVS